MARPFSLAVDDAGSIYAFDFMLGKIFKFDKNYRYVKSFCGKGRGPGETAAGFYGKPRIYHSPDGFIFMSDPGNKKLLKFNLDGTLNAEYKLDARLNYLPAVDASGNVYVYSRHNGAVDVYNKKIELIHTLLSDRDYFTFVNFKPKPVLLRSMYLEPGKNNPDKPIHPDMGDTGYTIVGKNRLIIFQKLSLTLYIFENFKLVRKFNIYPARGLENQKRAIVNSEKALKKMGEESAQSVDPVFYRLFADEDDENIFYLQGMGDYDKPVLPIYKFNLKGELLKVLYIDLNAYGYMFFLRKKGTGFTVPAGPISIIYIFLRR